MQLVAQNQDPSHLPQGKHEGEALLIFSPPHQQRCRVLERPLGEHSQSSFMTKLSKLARVMYDYLFCSWQFKLKLLLLAVPENKCIVFTKFMGVVYTELHKDFGSFLNLGHVSFYLTL